MFRKLLTVLALLPTALPAEEKTSTGDVTDITTIVELAPDSPFQKTWQPGLALLSNGTYLVSYGLELKGKVDMGSVMATTSPDRGKNWSKPLPVFDSTHITPDGKRFAYANSVLYQEPESKLVWCFAMRCPYEFVDSENSELVAAVSEDSGKTWVPREITNSYDSHLITCAGIVRLVEDGHPRYLLPVHRNTYRHDPKNGDRRQFVLESPDLTHWKLAGMVPFPESGEKIFLHEGNIAPGQKPDTLEMIMRTATYADYTPSGSAPRLFLPQPRRRPHLVSRKTGTRPLQHRRQSLFRPELRRHPHPCLQHRRPLGTPRALVPDPPTARRLVRATPFLFQQQPQQLRHPRRGKARPVGLRLGQFQRSRKSQNRHPLRQTETLNFKL